MDRDVIGEINYFSSSKNGDSPSIIASSVSTMKRSNFIQTPVHVTIHDLRGKEKSVNLDRNGFEVMKYDGAIQEEFEENSEAQKTYFEEISNLLKKRLGASRVIICHYAFRSRKSSLKDEQCNDTHRNHVLYPHIDANPIINKSLTICDYSSIDVNRDVHPLTIHRSDHSATAYTISHNPQDVHKWYYLSEMRSDEMFIFKNFDSKPDVAQFAVHTAFNNNDIASTSNLEQKSLELRCFIFYDV